MKYKFIDPEAQTDPLRPSKEALLTQIEADHLAASQAGDDDQMQELDRRYKDVSGTKTDAQARKAYDKAVEDAAAEPSAAEGGEEEAK